MRILCFGDREWTDIDLIIDTLRQHITFDNVNDTIIIEGECRGADRLSKYAATYLGVRDENIRKFPAFWKRYGVAAGPIRNQQMLIEGKPTLGIMFHDDIAASRGSKDMLSRLLGDFVPVIHVSHSGVIHIGEYKGKP